MSHSVCSCGVAEQWNGRRRFRLFLCLFTNLFCKFGPITKLESWWQVLNCSVKEVGLWGLHSCFGHFFSCPMGETSSEYKWKVTLWPRHTKFCVSTPHNHKRLLLQGPDPNKIKHWCRRWEQDSTEQNEVKLQVLKCLPKALQCQWWCFKEHFDTKPNSSYAQWPLAACPTQTVKKPYFKTPSSNEKKSILQISLQRLFLC